ncbi:hypothetical protein PG996_011059 [Apiospora saccharicola]|uniref:Uncharacterized protein n=1 Tax=Apiospora saccharicola TaxID=335842 RepID=A0ABR1UDY5_9PEZI
MDRVTQPDANAALRDEWDGRKIHGERSAIYVHCSIDGDAGGPRGPYQQTLFPWCITAVCYKRACEY